MKFLSRACLVLIICSSMAESAPLQYNSISEINSFRYGAAIARYVKKFGESCLSLEILDPSKSLLIVRSKKFCSIDGKSFMDDFSYAGFTNIKFLKSGLELELELTPLRSDNEETRLCSISIRNGDIGELQCEPTSTH